MRILLVDDDSDMRDATRALLEVQGHRVLEASRGREALDLAERRGIDLLMTELSIPDLGGVALADRLSELGIEHGHPIAVVLQSSRSDDPDLLQRVLDGDMAFLRKPFSAAELLEEIDSAVAKAVLARRTLQGQRPLEAYSPIPLVADSVLEPVASPAVPSAGVDEPAAAPAVVEAAAARPGWSPRLWQLVASVLLVLAAGGILRTLVEAPPPLSEPPQKAVLRGTEIEAVQPRGEVAAVPALFEWRPAGDRDHYRVTVRAVDDRVLWSGDIEGARLEPPPELTAQLHPAVSYTWTIEAVDAGGQLLARSNHVRFRIAPTAAAAGEPP